MNLSLSSPSWLLLIPVAITLLIILHHRRRHSLLDYAFDGSQQAISRHNLLARTLLLLSRSSLIAAVLLIIVALAGPTQLRYHTPAPNNRSELIFVLDLSPSMAVIDKLGQSRLDAARAEISHFLQLQRDIAIGLVGFGSEAALLVPPSPYYRTIQQKLEQVQDSALGEGTAIGAGLALAANHLRERDRKRSIVLISDGGNNSGAIQPEIAFRLLRQLGIELYIIALQRPPSDQVLLRDPKTGQLYQARLRNDQGWDELRALLEEEKIGQFFQAGSLEELSTAMHNIESDEEGQQALKKEVKHVSVHSQFVVLASILVLVGWLLPKLLLREML